MFWKLIQYEKDFLKQVDTIGDLSRWRLQYFITNIANEEKPLSKWNHKTCPTHKDFHLIGLNDDGLGNKKLEILFQIDENNKVLRFCMIKELEN